MADVVDLKGIKDAIKVILDGANTTTASPVDLSNNLTKRVQKVLTVHPLMIMPQASFYPFVTCYVTNKDIESQAIAKSALDTQRRANVEIEVVGAVWVNNVSDDLKDAADDQINYLMENVELALRAGAAENISSKVKYQTAQGCQYYSSALDEKNSVRAGILTLKATVFY